MRSMRRSDQEPEGPRCLVATTMRKETWKVRLWALKNVPLIHHVRPRLVAVDDERAEIVVPLGRRTKNHWGSMYFGALAIGADLAAGLHCMHATEAEKATSGARIGFVFKDVQGDFLRRPDGDVHFVSDQGAAVAAAVKEAAASGERVNIPVPITCTVPTEGDEPVATFTLTLSLKRR